VSLPQESAEETERSVLAGLLETSRLIVCCGSGGVGKTTMAAALALRAAREGRRAVVITIDPAKRLANSLGLAALDDKPQRIDLRSLDATLAESSGQGELWAMMLDVKTGFDDLVRRMAPDEGAVKRILNNRVYRLLSTALHGMHEYVATQKLFELYTGGYFDLVVLDTPPTKNALDFLESPGLLSRFLDRRVIKWFLPDERAGFFGRLFQPGAVVIKLLSRILGEQFTHDLVEFFDAIQAIIEPFQQRGEMVEFILRDPLTAFLIVTNPDPRRANEALFFHEKLKALEQRSPTFVVNRVCTGFSQAQLDRARQLSPAEFEALARAMAPVTDAQGTQQLLDLLQRHYQGLATLAARDDRGVRQLSEQVGKRLLHRVPLFRQDVHDIQHLLRIGEHLAGQAV